MARAIAVIVGDMPVPGVVLTQTFSYTAGLRDDYLLSFSQPDTWTAAYTDNGDGTWTSAAPTDLGNGIWSA